MMIPLTHEEYFENEVCMSCYTPMDYPIQFYFPNNETLSLCGSCSFGIYQCARCHCLVSHLENTLHPEMVYTGPEGTFEDFFIRCRECAFSFIEDENIKENEEEYETDVEESFEMCENDTNTQIIL